MKSAYRRPVARKPPGAFVVQAPRWVSVSANFATNGFEIDFTTNADRFREIYDTVLRTVQEIGGFQVFEDSQVLSSAISPRRSETVDHEEVLA